MMARSRRLLFETASERYEQDASGIVYADGVPVWPTAPCAVGSLNTSFGSLRVGSPGVLVFAAELEPGLWTVRLRLTPALRAIASSPFVDPVEVDWAAHFGRVTSARRLPASMEIGP